MVRRVVLFCVLLPVLGLAPVSSPAAAEPSQVSGVGPAEDLMREHSVLARILLIYDELANRIESGKDYSPAVLAAANGIARRFIEDYHEKLEENNVFPVFEKTAAYGDLVAVLRKQHREGRRLTDDIKALSGKGKSQKKLVKALRDFIRMYRPHAAREDTVLYPALHTLLQPRAYAVMGDIFEDKEEDLFGKNGFEKIVAEVAGLEKKLGMYDLSHYTPVVIKK